MKVTGIWITKIRPGNVALADIELDGVLKVMSLRILTGDRGLYVAYPPDALLRGDGMAVFPETMELAEHIESAVLNEYRKVVHD